MNERPLSVTCDLCNETIKTDNWKFHLKDKHKLTPGKLRRLIKLKEKLAQQGKLKVVGESGMIYVSDYVDLMDTRKVVSGGAPSLGKKR